MPVSIYYVVKANLSGVLWTCDRAETAPAPPPTLHKPHRDVAEGALTSELPTPPRLCRCPSEGR